MAVPAASARLVAGRGAGARPGAAHDQSVERFAVEGRLQDLPQVGDARRTPEGLSGTVGIRAICGVLRPSTK